MPSLLRRSMIALAIPVLAAAGVTVTLVAPAGAATPAPVVTGLSQASVPFWGGNQIAVYGRNFANVRRVTFGGQRSYGFQVVSSTKITVTFPEHAKGRAAVQVATASGTSRVASAGIITFRDPVLADRINGGWSAAQEQRIAAGFMATARQRESVPLSPRATYWYPGMGQSAVRRARAWLGMPYSFAGGNTTGPTRGVCSTSQGSAGALDCYVTGFDCSGLTMYSWGPYLPLAHFAATQFSAAGAHHPTPAQLMPGDLLFFGSTAANIHHVAMYEGMGRVIQAPQSGSPVSETTLSDVLNWDYFGATRPRTAGARSAAPVITSVLNQVPTEGGWAEVSGRNFTNITSVTVGGQMGYVWKVTGAGRVAIRVPAHASGTTTVAISNAGGTSRAVTVTYAPKPYVQSISAFSGPTTGGQAFTITGTGFGSVYQVLMGTTPVTALKVRSANTLVMLTPAHLNGRVTITVNAKNGSAVARSTYVFVRPPAPTTTKK